MDTERGQFKAQAEGTPRVQRPSKPSTEAEKQGTEQNKGLQRPKQANKGAEAQTGKEAQAGIGCRAGVQRGGRRPTTQA